MKCNINEIFKKMKCNVNEILVPEIIINFILLIIFNFLITINKSKQSCDENRGIEPII